MVGRSLLTRTHPPDPRRCTHPCPSPESCSHGVSSSRGLFLYLAGRSDGWTDGETDRPVQSFLHPCTSSLLSLFLYLHFFFFVGAVSALPDLCVVPSGPCAALWSRPLVLWAPVGSLVLSACWLFLALCCCPVGPCAVVQLGPPALLL